MQNRIYGSLPEVVLDHFETKAEIMFAQYYPIKLAGADNIKGILNNYLKHCS